MPRRRWVTKRVREPLNILTSWAEQSSVLRPALGSVLGGESALSSRFNPKWFWAWVCSFLAQS